MCKFLLLLFISTQVYSQKNAFPFDYDLHCVYKKKFSDSSRHRFYPFNVAAEIRLVSFRYQSYDTVVYKSRVKTDSLVEVKILSRAGLDSLTDILYNNFYKKAANIAEISLCFTPRNAILFIDSLGKVYESIGICFHCDRYEASSKQVKTGDDCSEKIVKLRTFFIKQGIKLGTDINIYQYPGETIRDLNATIPPPKN